jgi:SEC-C motif
VNGKCRLCGKEGQLILSHLIPRFAVQWLKRTSATGFLRNLSNPAKRQQETHREYLLCATCEQVLGRDEKAFAERIFIPHQQKNKPTSFTYEEWFLRFAVGLHWRALVTSDPVPENVQKEFARAEENWRQYLLRQAPDPGPTEFHVQFVDVVENSTATLPKKINWYVARAFDASPIFTPSGNDTLFYVKLPRIIMVAFISPRDPATEDWKGTQIATQGAMQVKQTVYSERFFPFFLERARAVEEAPPTFTERQMQKMLEQAKANPKAFLDSDSFQVHLADRRMRTMEEARARRIEVKGRDRNKPCPCGSGKKAKKCHGA